MLSWHKLGEEMSGGVGGGGNVQISVQDYSLYIQPL